MDAHQQTEAVQATLRHIRELQNLLQSVSRIIVGVGNVENGV
jgi:hypothetical protein